MVDNVHKYAGEVMIMYVRGGTHYAEGQFLAKAGCIAAALSSQGDLARAVNPTPGGICCPPGGRGTGAG